MKTLSIFGKRKLALLSLVACMIVAGSTSALAVPTQEVFVTFTDQHFTELCCFSWGDTVQVTEPAKVTPVVVTWSSEYFTNGIFLVGLSVNGGFCTAYGPRTLENWAHATDRRTQTFHWVIKPSDGLVPGTNTFTLCGGADASTPGRDLFIGFRTLAAQLEK